MLRRELDSMEGTMWTSYAGCRTSCASLFTVAAAVLARLSNLKILLDVHPVGMRGAVGVPTLDVAALSTTMEGMDPLRTPFLMNFSRAVMLSMLLMCSCTSTWQDGRAMLYKIA